MSSRARALLAVAGLVALVALSWMLTPHEQAHEQAADVMGGRAVAGIGSETAPTRVASAMPAIAESASATPVAPGVVLTGVAVGIDGHNLALVSIDKRPELLLRVGDTMPGPATVVHIDDTSMTYRRAGIDFRVPVKAAQAGVALAKPDAQAKTYPGFVAGAPAMARASGTEPGSGNDAFRQAIEKKLQAIAAGR